MNSNTPNNPNNIVQEDLNRLAPYCPCPVCKSERNGWMGYFQSFFQCRTCHGCIKSEFPDQAYINAARNEVNNNNSR